VPSGAVLDRGIHQIIFVDRGGGHLEPRQVVTGNRTAERIEVLQGLGAGEHVVSSGHFLIDSESRLYDQPAH
jgi:Cu(I)/Ag(I) efflux system membrane fusion protein